MKVKELIKLLPPEHQNRGWMFLTNHCHVIVCLYEDPTIRIREIAMAVGITERAVQRILYDLEEVGTIKRIRDGRTNRYEINLKIPLRHPLESDRTIGDLLQSVSTKAKATYPALATLDS